MLWSDTHFSENHQVSSTGLIRNKKSGRVLKPWSNKDGYLSVRFGKKGRNVFVHRVVAYAFIPMELGKLIINHKNGITYDNRVENLEWCDKRYNFYHAIEIGLCDGKPNVGHVNSIGVKNSNAKLTELDIKEIRKLRKQGLTLKQIADIFNVGLANISSITQRKTWKHVI